MKPETYFPIYSPKGLFFYAFRLSPHQGWCGDKLGSINLNKGRNKW